LEDKALQRLLKINRSRIKLSSNKFLQNSLSPKLCNKVCGVFINTINRFWGSQTCGDGDFCMFSYCFKKLYKKSAEIACKKEAF